MSWVLMTLQAPLVVGHTKIDGCEMTRHYRSERNEAGSVTNT